MKPLTPKTAAARIGVNRSFIYQLLRAGRIPAMRVGCRGKGRWLIAVEAFDKWAKSCEVAELAEDGGDHQYLSLRGFMAVSMSDSSTWVLGDVLPLVKAEPGGLWPAEGLLIAGRGPLVYLTNAFLPGLTRRLRECEKVYYKCFEDAAADGWQVD